MKICLIGNYYPNQRLDEGMAKAGYYLNRELSQRHDVLHLSVKRLFSIEFWKTIKAFQPQVIHFIPGASARNLLLVRILRFYCGKAKIVTSVQQPNFSAFTKLFIPWLKPDLVLVQSRETEEVFASAGCRTEFLPNGVDCEEFMPASPELKQNLRKKYKVDIDKPLVLHIGPLRKWRNADVLEKIQRQGNSQVIAVASTTNPSEEKVCEQLRKAGCIVWQTYFSHVKEMYALSDYYIFPPTYKLGSIESPLSVMEAMSCNLPVISTRYGALPRMFQEGDGLYFAERDTDLIPLLERVKTNNQVVKTREKVMAYTWESITERLEQMYADVANVKRVKKPFLICLTGMDGTGKTTQAENLVKALKAKGIKCGYVWDTYQPFLTKPFIVIIRTLFFRGKDAFQNYAGYDSTKKQLFGKRFLAQGYRYLALFDYLCQSFIRIRLPLLLGKNIVSDRYIYDFVVNLAVDLNYSDKASKRLLHKLSHLLPEPDIAFLIDLPEEVCFQRKGDIPSIEHLIKRRKLYLRIGKESGLIMLDGSSDIGELGKTIENDIKRTLKLAI